MYDKDKRTRITLRVNDDQFSFVKTNADIMGVSPSDFLRILINTCMYTDKRLEDSVKDTLANVSLESAMFACNNTEEVSGRGNDKTAKHNFI